MNITNFPFRRLGELVRNMSLSGTFGNLCAWALLVLLSLIPVAVLVVLRLRKKSLRVDWCLIPIAIAEAVTIYLSVNPMLIGDRSMRIAASRSSRVHFTRWCFAIWCCGFALSSSGALARKRFG